MPQQQTAADVRRIQAQQQSDVRFPPSPAFALAQGSR